MDDKVSSLTASNLFRVERYTDLIAGEIICNIPITEDTIEDPIRQRQYLGTTNLSLSNGQTLNVTFPLAAKSLAEAIAFWTPALENAIAEVKSNATRQRILNGAGLPAPKPS
jgi:hypothetical protein